MRSAGRQRLGDRLRGPWRVRGRHIDLAHRAVPYQPSLPVNLVSPGTLESFWAKISDGRPGLLECPQSKFNARGGVRPSRSTIQVVKPARTIAGRPHPERWRAGRRAVSHLEAYRGVGPCARMESN